MIETDYKSTALWLGAFERIENNKSARFVTKLAGAYDELCSAVKPLLEQTARTLPQLTDHSGYHVDQLWEVASTICGPHYSINPLEAFILGASFAFHDAALTVEAYPGGLEELKSTPQWRDATIRAWHARGVREPTKAQIIAPPSDLVDLVLFTVLRLEHARQAEKLPFIAWEHPSTRAPLTRFQMLSCGMIMGV
jgi:hypothetical protein